MPRNVLTLRAKTVSYSFLWFSLALVTVDAHADGAALGAEQNAEQLLVESETALLKGDYQRSLQLSDRAAAMFHRAGDTAQEAAAVNQTGLCFLYRTEYGPALQKFRQAVKLDEQAKTFEQQVVHLNNIGNVYLYEGKYSEAVNQYERALRLSKSPASDRRRPRGEEMSLVNLAVLYQQLGQNDRAMAFYRKAQELQSSVSPAQRGQLLTNIGTLYRRLGDSKKALENYRSAQALFSKSRHADREVNAIENIGVVLALDFHDHARADSYFSEAIDLAQSLHSPRQEAIAHLYRAESRFRQGRAVASREDYAASLATAEKSNLAEEKWAALFGMGKTLERESKTDEALSYYQRSMSVIESLRGGLRRDSLRTEFLANKRDVYNGCIRLLLGKTQVNHAELFSLLEKARERRLQDTVEANQHSDISDVRSQLRPDDALLEFWIDRGEIASILVTRSNLKLMRASLPEGLEAAIRAFVQQTGSDQNGNWRHASQTIGKLLLPSRESLKNVRHLIIVPDGILSSVPFEALSVDGKMLVVLVEVSYLPAARLLSTRESIRKLRLPWEHQLIAFGDPRSDSVNAGSTPTLPYSKTEIETVARSLHGRKWLYAGSNDLKRYLTGPSRSEAVILHISTHAAVNELDPKQSSILFSPEQGVPGSELLFLREAQQLNLNGTDLVTLSACSTEAGKLTPGEGLGSFGRAFLGAGARSTLTTLWPVTDQASAEFMKQFYYHLAKGETKAAALRSAKLRFLNSGLEWAEPRFWAPYVLNGISSEPVPRALSWQVFLVALCLSIGLLAGLCITTYRYMRARRAMADRID